MCHKTGLLRTIIDNCTELMTNVKNVHYYTKLPTKKKEEITIGSCDPWSISIHDVHII